MIKPLAYLASEEEMSQMLSSARPKVALDEFWIKCGGNIDKSRELIRIFIQGSFIPIIILHHSRKAGELKEG